MKWKIVCTVDNESCNVFDSVKLNVLVDKNNCINNIDSVQRFVSTQQNQKKNVNFILTTKKECADTIFIKTELSKDTLQKSKNIEILPYSFVKIPVIDTIDCNYDATCKITRSGNKYHVALNIKLQLLDSSNVNSIECCDIFPEINAKGLEMKVDNTIMEGRYIYKNKYILITICLFSEKPTSASLPLYLNLFSCDKRYRIHKFINVNCNG